MNPKHYIFTRWSVYDPTWTGWIMTRNNDSEAIKQKLFNASRLKAKFEFFEKMTYPSVKKQTYGNYEWYIYTSTLLPKEYKDKLERLQLSNITIVYVDCFADLERHVEKTIENVNNFTTITLDDDDGIVPTFLEKLNKHCHTVGTLVTFPQGLRYTIENGNIVIGGKYYFPNINLGLAAIGHNIFRTGDHTKIHKTYSVISDETPDMWWCACSVFCDTNRGFTKSSTKN